MPRVEVRRDESELTHAAAMVRDGIPFVVVPIVLAAAPFLFGYWLLALPLFALAGFMAFFFRDPHRSIPAGPGIVVAPADGRVTIIRLADGHENAESLISIFLSPLDVHINRAPIAGEIVEIAYKTGKFVMATKAEARLLNERNTLIIKGEALTVKCTQIAGILARRIVCPGAANCLLEAEGGKSKMRRTLRHDKVWIADRFAVAANR